MFLATATMSVSSSKMVGQAVPRPRTSYATDVEVHRRVELIGPEHAHGHAAGDGTLELLAASHAAAMSLDQFPKRDAQIALVDARTFDMAGDAHQLGSVAGGPPVGALAVRGPSTTRRRAR